MAAQQVGTSHTAVGETDLKFGDGSLQFSFKFEGSPYFSFVIKDRNFKGSPDGPICRLEITPETIKLQDDKTSSAEAEKSPEGRNDAIESIGETSVAVAADLKPGTWHTIILDIEGAVMKVRLDGEEIVSGTEREITYLHQARVTCREDGDAAALVTNCYAVFAFGR